MDVPAVVTEYDPRWPEVFERLRDRLDAALVGVAHVTEHVGSTAVPGLAAKPIIDLDIVVKDEVAVGPAIKALGAAGWQHEGDLGIKGREVFRPPEDAAYHHLYLVVAESPPHRDHIDLRDFLRTHPGHAARYAALKRQLAALLKTDRAAYVAGKHEMITEFLRLARSKGTTPADPAAPERTTVVYHRRVPSEESGTQTPHSERKALEAFLDSQREAIIRKIEGLDDATARKAPTASVMSLLGIVKHCGLWERRWLQVVVAGRRFPGEWPEGNYTGMAEDFIVDESDTVDQWVGYYREQIEQSRAIAASMDLDTPCARTDLIEGNLRYVLYHLIEETARHAGHMDIIRETLDGTVGI